MLQQRLDVHVSEEALQTEADDVYELQDHEYTIVAESETEGAELSASAEAKSARNAAAPDPVRQHRKSGVYEVPLPSVAAAGASASIADVPTELGRLKALLRARDAYALQLHEALEASTRRLVDFGQSTARNTARLQGRLRGQSFRIAELEAQWASHVCAPLPAAACTAPPPAATFEAAGDDLQRIHGIGPRFAQDLVALGFTRFAQIAAWTEPDIARVCQQLRITAARIERGAWIAQARALAHPALANAPVAARD